MPLIDQLDFREERTLGRKPVTLEDTSETYVPLPEKPSVGDIFEASFESINTLGTTASYLLSGGLEIGKGQVDPNFDPFDDIKGTKYERFADKFIKSGNRTDQALIKNRLDVELQNEEVLRNSGAMGVVALFASGAIDLTMLIPFTGVAKFIKGASILRGVATGASVGLLAGSTIEATRLATQLLVTKEEAIENIAESTVFGAVIGGAIEGIGAVRKRNAYNKFKDDMADVPDTELNEYGYSTREASSLSAMATPESVTNPDAYKIAGGSNPVSNLALKGILKIHSNPQTRLAKSPSSFIREMATRIYRTGGIIYEGTKFDPEGALPVSAESRRNLILSDYHKSAGTYEDAWGKFKKSGKAEKHQMNDEAFGLEVIRRIEEHPPLNPALRDDPDIKKGALQLKSFILALTKRLEDVGYLDAEKVEESKYTYFPIMYDREKVIRNPNAFKKLINDVLTENTRPYYIEKSKSLEQEIALSETTQAKVAAEKQTEEKGMFPIEDYFYEIEQEREKLEEELESISLALNNESIMRTRISDSVEEVYSHITRSGMETPEIARIGTVGALKGRVLNASTMVLEPFIIRNPLYVLERYAQRVGSVLSLKESLGEAMEFTPGGGIHISESGTEQLKREFQKLAEGKSPDEKVKLNKIMRDNLKDISAGIEILTQSGERFTFDPSDKIVQGIRAFKLWNYLTKMGNVVLSSLSDMSRFVSAYGFTKIAKHVPQRLFAESNIKKINREELAKIGTFTDAYISRNLASLSDVGRNHGTTLFERFINNISNGYTQIIGLNVWNRFFTEVSTDMSSDNLINLIEKFNSGKNISKQEWLTIRNTYKLSNKDMVSMGKELEKHGVTAGSVKIPYYEKWGNEELARKFRIGVTNEVQRVIMTKDIANTPLWFSNNTLSLISQFRSFAYTMTTKGVIPALQGADTNAIGGVAMASLIGSFSVVVKDLLAGREVESDPVKLLVKGFAQSGFLGVISEVDGVIGSLGLPSLAGYTYGHYSYTDRNVFAGVSPTGGTLEDIVAVLSYLKGGEFDNRRRRALRKLIPGQNIFYLRRLYDKIDVQD